MIARKLAVLFVFNRGIPPFYAACCFNVLSGGSVSCLLNASLEIAFYTKIGDHGIRWGDTGRILALWRPPVASRVALDLPYWYWAMRSAPYRLIRMVIEMASKSAAFFSVVDYLSCITVAK